MGDPRGFLKIKREHGLYRPICERIGDYGEVALIKPDQTVERQASRCMDCGTPFCHSGCPIGNLIPEWNDLVFHRQWGRAFDLLQATNNLPEITGRLCPALCEYACVLGLTNDPVTIRENELSVIEHAFKSGAVTPKPPRRRTGKCVAVVGSGPAGLAAAMQLNRAGHRIALFEKDAQAGGILRFGIPDFKLDKKIIDRRLALMRQEGIEIITGSAVGTALAVERLTADFDAVCLACGSRVARDLAVPGRELAGIHFAMDYLTQSNRRVAGETIPAGTLIDAAGKKVVVIGGGDTGADCIGTAHRQGAECVVQIEVMPQPSQCRTAAHPWPQYPLILKSSTSHEEGGERHWSILTKRFIGTNGRVSKLSCVRVDFSAKDAKGCPVMNEVPESAFEIDADLVLIAVGFLHPERSPLVTGLDLALDNRGNIKTDASYQTSAPHVFAAGDMRRGQSLIVWAISEGRQAAYHIDKYLMGTTSLPKM